MKNKFLKVLACGCLAGALCAGGFAIAGCAQGNPSSEGSYHYTNYGHEYGVKVNVEIQSEEGGDRIRKVTIVDSSYIQLSDANPDLDWTDEKRQNYLDKEQSLLNAYRGMYVVDVLAMKASTDIIGQPTAIEGDDEIIATGATQSSGRLLLAVQDALCNYGYSVFEGEYSYPNAWNPAESYGIAVRVVMKGNVIKKVVAVDSDYIEVSPSWEDKDTWNNNVEALLNSYVGKTRSEVLYQVATVNDFSEKAGDPTKNSITMGQPVAGGTSYTDGGYVITGATQGSKRLLMAVQNALDPLGRETTRIYQGEYKYVNEYNVLYGIRVAVTVKGGVIKSVARIPYDKYTQISSANPDYGWQQSDVDNYNNNEADLLEKYTGMTVNEVMSVSSETNEYGQPDSVGNDDLIISGATQSSGRILLAVQKALSLIGTASSGDEEEQPGKYDDWQYNEYIDDATTYTANSDGSVTYNIVTLGNSPAGSFELTIKVAGGKISEYKIDVNGSTSTSFADSMSDVAKNMTGKTLADLEAYLESDEIKTGATYSNELCVNAGLFALANVEKAGGTVTEPDKFEGWEHKDFIDQATTYTVNSDGSVTYNIVTLSNGRAQSFTIKITVDTNKVITDYEIVVNGSSPASFADSMSALAKNLEGQTLASLEAILAQDDDVEDDVINTGATKSNELCVNAALFAVANFDKANPDAEAPSQISKFEGWKYSDFIEDSTAITADAEGNVTYTIVTKSNGHAQSFTISITVDKNKTITAYEIVVNGSTSERFEGMMSETVKNLVGKTQSDLEAILAQDDDVEDDVINTGATKSNELCVNAALFAVANYDLGLKSAEGDAAYVGEYKYENSYNPGSYYGIRVLVVVKNDAIVSVTIVDSDYTEVTDSWGDKDLWLDGIQNLLNSYNGRTVAEVLGVNVVTNEGGQPDSVSDSDYIISGATQGSGRLVLAVQNALRNAGYERYVGEYKYENSYNPGSYYGIKVAVTVKDNVIVSVDVLDSDYTEVTDSWKDKDLWLDGIQNLLNSYKGRTVAEVLGVNVVTNEGGQPDSVSDSDYIIVGATQGSGRLVLAIQNALRNGGYSAYTGEYHYNNYGTEYGVKVAVTVKNGYIEKVEIADSTYTQLSPANPDYGWTDTERQNYLDNEAKLLASYEGLAVGQVAVMNVTVDSVGQPTEVTEDAPLITGATQSSGRILLAVLNALGY